MKTYAATHKDQAVRVTVPESERPMSQTTERPCGCLVDHPHAQYCAVSMGHMIEPMSQPAARQTCTCRSTIIWADGDRIYNIDYCPTHAEAFASAEVLRRVVRMLDAGRGNLGLVEIRAILARIDGPREAIPCDASSGGAR